MVVMKYKGVIVTASQVTVSMVCMDKEKRTDHSMEHM